MFYAPDIGPKGMWYQVVHCKTTHEPEPKIVVDFLETMESATRLCEIFNLSHWSVGKGVPHA